MIRLQHSGGDLIDQFGHRYTLAETYKVADLCVKLAEGAQSSDTVNFFCDHAEFAIKAASEAKQWARASQPIRGMK